VIVQGVSLVLQAGQGLGIIGPSASGKSSLVRAIVGLWPTVRGRIRLDGAALEHRSPLTLGRHIGYMPQGIELFDGTVAENIARFRDDAIRRRSWRPRRPPAPTNDPQAWGGYNTRVGDGERPYRPASASGSPWPGRSTATRSWSCWTSRTPISTTMAKPRSPRPSRACGARKGIVVVVAHRPSALIALDQVLVLANGGVQALGPRDEVLRKVLARQPDVAAGPGAPTAAPQLRAAASGGGAPKTA
jgi:ATP-binding cassette subfamily C protein